MNEQTIKKQDLRIKELETKTILLEESMLTAMLAIRQLQEKLEEPDK